MMIRTMAQASMAGLLLALAACSTAPQAATTAPGFQETFAVDKGKLASRGTAPYFVLQPGYRLHYRHGADKLTITVLNETKVVDGVETRIVEEREEEGGELVEISRNYFALDPATGDVYYFGEDVDIYRSGKVVKHDGAWLSGVDGARFGLIMPGKPRVGQKFQIEVAPKVAMDRAEVSSVTATVETPAGTFRDCVAISESSALEKGGGHKAFAPGVGLVRDDEFLLVKVERP